MLRTRKAFHGTGCAGKPEDVLSNIQTTFPMSQGDGSLLFLFVPVQRCAITTGGEPGVLPKGVPVAWQRGFSLVDSHQATVFIFALWLEQRRNTVGKHFIGDVVVVVLNGSKLTRVWYGEKEGWVITKCEPM